MKKFVLSLEPYDTQLFVILGTSQEARRWKKTSTYLDVEHEFEVGGASLTCDKYWPVMFLNTNLTKKQRTQTFCHECIHIINATFDRCGVILSLIHI